MLELLIQLSDIVSVELRSDIIQLFNEEIFLRNETVTEIFEILSNFFI